MTFKKDRCRADRGVRLSETTWKRLQQTQHLNSVSGSAGRRK